MVEKGKSLSNLLIKLGEIIEVSLNLFNGQVNKHASDLGSSLVTNKFLNILIDELTDETLVVRVFRYNGGKITKASNVVAGNNGIGVGKWALRNSLNSRGSNDDLLRSRIMLRRNILIEYLVSWTTLSLIVVLVPVVVVRVSTLVSSGSRTITVLIVVHLTTVILRPVVVKKRLAEIHLLLEKKKNLLNKLKCVWLLKNASIYLCRSKLLPLIVEISLVLALILLLLADFRKLIMSHIEILSMDRSTVELLSGQGCAIGLLVANKCAGRRLPIVRW